MRKLFLCLAFVFTTGTMLNASSTEEVANCINCVQFAFDLEEITGEMDYETFDAVVSLCEVS